MSDERATDQFRDLVIIEVVADESGDHWSLRFNEHTGLGLTRADFDVDVPRDLAPKAGDVVRLYGPKHELHGVA